MCTCIAAAAAEEHCWLAATKWWLGQNVACYNSFDYLAQLALGPHLIFFEYTYVKK